MRVGNMQRRLRRTSDIEVDRTGPQAWMGRCHNVIRILRVKAAEGNRQHLQLHSANNLQIQYNQVLMLRSKGDCKIRTFKIRF